MAENSTRDGLSWQEQFTGHEPKWTRKPTVDCVGLVCRKELGLGPDDECNITFLRDGKYDRSYLVNTTGKKPHEHSQAALRISLPIIPEIKTLGDFDTGPPF